MGTRAVVKKFIPKKVFKVVEPYGHLTEAVLFNTLSGMPAHKFKIIGVTGTNGKTTTCFLIHRMLHEAGFKVGLMTTVGYGVGEAIKAQDVHMTTVPVPILIKRFKQLNQDGAEWLVMETTSHALAQHRVWGMPFYLAVLTNLTHEHLDYHGSFEKYRSAKLRLFNLVAKNRGSLGVGVINADDPSAAVFEAAAPKPLTYGIKNGDIQAINIKQSADGSDFMVKTSSGDLQLRVNLPGLFNIYNSLAAVGVGLALNLSSQQIEQGIAALKSVPGRMTRIDEGQAFNVIVDYAVTPDALKNVLQTTREITPGRLILVFGATGDRDKTKRPQMGQIAGKYADLIFLTDDETYTEDPAAIRKEVFEGIKEVGDSSKTQEVQDRLNAIKQAIENAQNGDTILLTGIGHQTTRNMGGKEVAWNEIEIIHKLLKDKKPSN